MQVVSPGVLNGRPHVRSSWGYPHVLVCARGRSSDGVAVQGGRVLADQLGGPLSVVYAFAPGEVAPPRRAALSRTRSAAAGAGVPLIELPAYSTADGLAEFARERGVTHIVMAAEPTGRSLFPGRPPLETELIARLDGVELLVITSWRPRVELAGSPLWQK